MSIRRQPTHERAQALMPWTVGTGIPVTLVVDREGDPDKMEVGEGDTLIVGYRTHGHLLRESLEGPL